MQKIAIVGIGYWGKNLVRVFSDLSDVALCVHQGNEKNREWLKENYPGIELVTDYSKVVSNPTIDAIVIATPIGTHHDLVEEALMHNKHVFVEKPLAEDPEKAKRLSDIAIQKNRVLFVGFIFVYHPTIKPLYDRGKSTSIAWCEFNWDKFGNFNENIFLDVVSHPVAVCLALFEQDPTSIGINYSRSITSSVDIVSIDLQFENSMFNINVNRLTPESKKSLQILFEGGEMFYWNEAGLYKSNSHNRKFSKEQETNQEPLQVECRKFISIINGNSGNQTNGKFGYRVNKIVQQIESACSEVL